MAVASRSSGGRRARMFEPEDEPAAARPWGDVADDSVDADITTQSSGASSQFEVHWVQAEEHDRAGRLPEALEAYEHAVIASEDESLPARNTLAAYRRMGVLHARMGDLSRCLTVYQRQLELASEVRRLHDVVRAHWDIGKTYYAMACAAVGVWRPPVAAPPAAAASSSSLPSHATGVVAAADGPSLSDVMVDCDRADVTAEQQEAEHVALGSALASFEAMLTLARGMHARRAVARAHEGIGSVAVALGKWELAAEHLQLNVQATKAAAPPRDAARACRLLAATLSRLRNEGAAAFFGSDKAVFDRQVELRWEQAALAEQAGDRSLLLDAYFALGRLLEESGSYTSYYGPRKAAAMYERVLELGREVDLRTLGPHGAMLAREAATRLDALNATGCVVS